MDIWTVEACVHGSQLFGSGTRNAGSLTPGSVLFTTSLKINVSFPFGFLKLSV